MIEIVCCSAEDARIAESAGATQIELCVAIELGGLTPSLGLLEVTKRKVNIPVYAMVRPRAGGFCYATEEFDVMMQDASQLLDNGADGIVFGILTADRQVDHARNQVLVNLADERQAIFHRAFDQISDQHQALEDLIQLGFSRVLTGGGSGPAFTNLENLRALHEQARDRIQILPGGGVRSSNIAMLLEATGILRAHLAPFIPSANDPDSRCTDPEEVTKVAKSLTDGGFCETNR